MTKPIKASEKGLESHYKVRVVIDGALIHLASRTQPRVTCDPNTGSAWSAEWINDPAYGDTLGFIDWEKVSAVTWRWSA